ncbi:MAG: flavodoxin family protein [Dehalococcoidales bacterium]|nr:flavodoxin family protein [Dehalococcoidales bacterium]
MKILVVYDSVYGNTEKIARAIAGAVTPPDEIEVLRASEAGLLSLETANILVVGSPTHGGRPVQAIKEFLNRIPADALRNVAVTSFDTRILGQGKSVGIRMLTKVFGYAAGRISDVLKAKGGRLVTEPDGFIVEDSEGPLKKGELERAADWMKAIIAAAK